MNLQELLKERERINKEIEKYEVEMQKREDLKLWEKHFSGMSELPMSAFMGHQIVGLNLPSHIREIILNALQAEIDKIEKQ